MRFSKWLILSTVGIVSLTQGSIVSESLKKTKDPEPDTDPSDPVDPDTPDTPEEPEEPTSPPQIRSGINLGLSEDALLQIRALLIDSFLPDSNWDDEDDKSGDKQANNLIKLPDYCATKSNNFGKYEMCQNDQKVWYSDIWEENVDLTMS
jgi:hypothetical protein